MTVDQINKLWELRCPPSSKLVLLALAKFSDKKGECFPSMKLLEQLTGLSRRAIAYQIDHLAKSKVIDVKSGQLQGGSNSYQIRCATIAYLGEHQLQTGSATPAYRVCKIEQAPNIRELSNGTTHLTMTNSIEKINAWKTRLETEFKRKPKAPWSHLEEFELVSVLRRPDCDTELNELLAYRKTAGRYFPNSIGSLLTDWTKHLDHARNATSNDKNNGRSNQGRISASAGTSNEGTAASYANAPALSRTVGKAH